MAKQVLLYGNINTYSAADFVTAMDEAKNDDIVVRVNSGGGEPESGWAAIGKFKEHTKNKVLKGEGKVYSMAAFAFCYSNNSECYDVTQWLLHRAAYADWVENSDSMDPAMWESLKKVNDLLKAALEAKVDKAKFKKVTGYTTDEMFAVPGRLDIEITAEQAKELGLVNRVIKITPDITAQINRDVESYYAKAAKREVDLRIAAEVTPIIQPKNNNKMTLEELKTQHPAIYTAAYNEGKTAGVTEERDRVEGLMVFAEIDAKLVKDKIADGKPLTAKETNELLLKRSSPEVLAKLKKEANANGTSTDEAPAGEKTKEAKELEEFEASVDKSIGLDKK